MAKANKKAPTDINSFLGEDDLHEESNEKAVLKSKLMSIVASLIVMDEEREMIKDMLTDLKEDHDIAPKVARKVAKILHKPELLQQMEDENFAIENLYTKIK